MSVLFVLVLDIEVQQLYKIVSYVVLFWFEIYVGMTNLKLFALVVVRLLSIVLLCFDVAQISSFNSHFAVWIAEYI